jgi:predicted transcriptional regulator
MLDVLVADVECGKASLAVKSNVDSRAMTKYLSVLFRYGLVERTSDARRSSIRISEKGKMYLDLYVKMVALLD